VSYGHKSNIGGYTFGTPNFHPSNTPASKLADQDLDFGRRKLESPEVQNMEL
jgi:hypothetical protein